MAEDNKLIKIENPREIIGEKTEKKSEATEHKIESGPHPEAEAGADRRVYQEIADFVIKTKERGGAGAASKGRPTTPAEEERRKKIEKILEKDLEDIYTKMSPEKQMEFAQAGEETSRKINELLGQGRVRVKKIIDLIRKWLSLIPGVNKFFLEQEAKIKTDEIIKNAGRGIDFKL